MVICLNIVKSMIGNRKAKYERWKNKSVLQCNVIQLRGAVKNVLADFIRKGGWGPPPPPPIPLTDNHFAKKTLADRGVPPPLNGQSPKKILKKWVKQG